MFTAAPSAPPNWTKRVSASGDSVIYTASADSSALPSGKVSNLFRFSVDPPSTAGFTIGWRTFRTLTDPLSTGDLQLQCNEQPPLKDIATIEVVDVCNWNLRVTNQHNTPSSDLYAIELSIPSGTGTLTAIASSLGWTKTNETGSSVRFVATAGGQQGSNTQQSILFVVNPQTPGASIPLRWATYDEAALQSNTPLQDTTLAISCTPVVNLCDDVSALPEPGTDTCMQNFTIHSKRNAALTGVTIEPQNGWTIDTAMAPVGWDIQLDGSRTLVNFTNSTGIAPEGTLSGFLVQFMAINQSDTFGVDVTTIDATSRECDTTLTFICKSQTAGVHDASRYIENVAVVPNPVTLDATIELTIRDQGRVHITLLDILGHEVADISNRIMSPGSYTLPLQMAGFQAGTYYLRIQTLAGIVTRKIVLTN
jgi:hypothetical protein